MYNRGMSTSISAQGKGERGILQKMEAKQNQKSGMHPNAKG